MKEYRGSIKKRGDVNWSCLSLLMHFVGTTVLQTTATKMLSPGTL